MTKVGMGCSGGEHQEVVGQGFLAAVNQPCARVNGRDFCHAYREVGLAREDGANGSGDVSGGQRGRGHLVQQGLEQVMVVAVDQGDLHLRLRQVAGCCKSRKASANNDHARRHGASWPEESLCTGG